MVRTDPCLEFMTTHLRSGTWHSADGSLAPPEFVSAPYVPGLHMVYGDIRSSVVQEALRAESPAGRGQMVHRPTSEAAATLDTDGALALARDANGPVLLPNSGQFDLAHPNFHPVDAGVQPDRSGSATQVLVLPPSDLPMTFERNAFPMETHPGLVIGNEAMAARVAAANPRFAPDEYPVFIHGSLLVGDPAELQNAITDVLNGLAKDEARAAGQNIVLVACDVAISPDGLDDAAAAFFARLPAQYPKLTAFPSATMEPLAPDAPAGQLSEVHATTTTVRPDGRLGLTAELIRTYTAPPSGDRRTPVIAMHPPTLSQARRKGVRVTDGDGRPLDLNDLEGQLRALGQDTRPFEPTPGSITFAGDRGRDRDRYIEDDEPDVRRERRRSRSTSHRDVNSHGHRSSSSRRSGSQTRSGGHRQSVRGMRNPPTSNNSFFAEVAAPPPPPPVDWLAVYKQVMGGSPSNLSRLPVGTPLRDAYDRFMSLSYADITRLPYNDPLRAVFDDPEGVMSRLPTGAAVRTSFDRFQSRFDQFPGLWNNPDIRMAFMNYKRQLTYEFDLKYYQGITDPVWITNRVNVRFGGSQVGRFVQLMADAGALSIPYKLWQDHQNRRDFQSWLSGAIADYRDKLALWGKLNPEVADRIAQRRGQRILESTPLGLMADDILFGMPSYSEGTPGYFEFWALASHHLVDVSTGEVEAHVFEGVMRKGVLDKTEVPALLAKIALGQISSLKITIWKLQGQVLVRAADIFIHSRTSYDRNAPLLDPNAMSPEYWKQQSRLYMQKIYRSAEMANRGFRNSQEPLIIGASGQVRRGGFGYGPSGATGPDDVPNPIFVLDEEINAILGDDGGRIHPRDDSALMKRLTEQARRAPTPPPPPLLPQRVPTGGGQNWSDYQGFGDGAAGPQQPRLRRASTHIGPDEDRRASASNSSSSSGSPGRRRPSGSSPGSRRRSSPTGPPQASSSRQMSGTLYEDPEELDFGGLSISENPFIPRTPSHPAPSGYNGGVNYGPNPLPRSFDQTPGMYGSVKRYNPARAGELTTDLVHPSEALRPERLEDRPGSLLFGADHAAKAEMDRNLNLPGGTYQFSMEGVAGFGALNGRKVSAEQVKDMILADQRSHDLDIALVQCDPAFPVSNALDSFLADLWRRMVEDGRWNPDRSIIGSVGGAHVRPGTDGRPGDVIAVSSTIAPDGSIRLNTGGFRSITGQPGMPPQLTQHGTALSEAVDEVRNGGGIALTDDLGNLVPLPRSQFLSRGLNDPVHVRAAVDHQADQTPPPATAGEDSAAPEPTWDLWTPANVTEIRPNVFVASSHPIPTTAEAETYYNALAANATDVNPIVDVGVNRNLQVAPRDVESAQLMLEQFAQRNKQAFLATRGRSTIDLFNATVPYGAPLFHQTPARGGGFSLGARFTFTLPGTPDREQMPAVITEGIAPELFEKARELARPTSAIRPVDDQLARMIWSKDLTDSREQFRQAAWTSEEMTQHLGEVSAMSERVGNLPKVAIVKPVLEFGAVGHADIVFDYGLTENTKRAGRLIDSVGGMYATGKLGTDAPDALTLGHFSSMVAASGTVDLSLPTLSALDVALADGDLDAVLGLYDQYKGKFTVNEKSSLLDGLGRLLPKMPEQTGSIQRVMQTILDC